MINALKRFIKKENGLSLPIVIGAFAFGSILLIPCLHYASTSLLSIRNQENETRGILAADAGIEDVLWSIQNGQTIRTALPQNINNMSVTMQTVGEGVYVLYRGDLVPATEHSYYVLMASGNIEWDADINAYKFTIYVTKTGDATGEVKLQDIGALLPLNYTYMPNSAALVAGNLSMAEPTTSMLGSANMVDWTWPNPGLTFTGTRTQSFYITGTGELENYYAWAQAIRNDVDRVSEFSGNIYEITATASNGSNVVSSVTAKVIKTSSYVRMLSWRINQ